MAAVVKNKGKKKFKTRFVAPDETKGIDYKNLE
jgi:hypothetical protein